MKISRRTLVRCLPFVSLIVCYPFGYLHMLTPEAWTYSMQTTDGSSLHVLAPKFKVEHPIVHALYAPLLWFDRKIRPTYWCWAERPEHPQGLHLSRFGGGGFGGGGFGGSTVPPIRFIEVDPKTGKPLEWQWDRGISK